LRLQLILANLETLDFSNETILIKGARSFQFEEIVYLLEEKTVLEINLNAISYNLNFKSKLAKVKMMVMVGFGYGNGVRNNKAARTS
jgi:alanine racemase